jgi:hypothetical protein
MAMMAAIKNVLSPISLAKITPQLLRKPSMNPEPKAPIVPASASSGRVSVAAIQEPPKAGLGLASWCTLKVCRDGR